MAAAAVKKSNNTDHCDKNIFQFLASQFSYQHQPVQEQFNDNNSSINALTQYSLVNSNTTISFECEKNSFCF